MPAHLPESLRDCISMIVYRLFKLLGVGIRKPLHDHALREVEVRVTAGDQSKETDMI